MGKCLAVMKKLSDFLQGKLSERETRRMRSHMEDCEDCRLVLESAQQTLRTYFTPSGDFAHRQHVDAA